MTNSVTKTSDNNSMESICYLPWVGLSINTKNEFTPCCKYSHSLADNLDDYKNSDELKKIQEQFIQGQRPEGCKKCWVEEDKNVPSKRQLDWQYKFNYKVPDINSFKVLNLTFGNTCNLACRTCDSVASSGWVSEARKMKKHISDIKIHKHLRFYQDKEYMNKIKSISDDLTYIEIAGGEPFLSGITEHLDFLDYLIMNDPKDKSLHYNTNVTVFPDERFWSRWKNFKKIDIQLSIDGIGQQFEYLRWPSKWDDVQNNIKRYIQQKNSVDNVQLSISHTVSVFNVYALPNFIKWCIQQKFDKPYLGLVVNPDMYSIKTLPKEVKDKITQKLNNFLLKDIAAYMNSEDWSSNLDRMIKYTQVLDKQRNQSFKEVFPELYQLLKDAECQI
jgi:MoaA/NifB/PqqE/SkfB family radical SAM enzyme